MIFFLGGADFLGTLTFDSSVFRGDLTTFEFDFGDLGVVLGYSLGFFTFDWEPYLD